MGWITVYSILSTIEAWVTGYKSEHLRLGLQQGIAQALALLPVLIDRVFKAVDKGGSALFIAVTVAVVLEPSTGDAFRKLALRLLGAGLSGGIGILLMFFAVGHNSYDYQSYQRELAAWMVPGLALLSCAYTVNQQRYGAYREFWSLSLFTLPIVVVPSIRAAPGTFYTGACYRLMDVVIGVGLAAAVSFFVFPVRARHMLEKRMAATLRRLGDLSVWLVGQVCVPPAPSSGALPGRSGSDLQCLYTDDGLRGRLQPLMAATNELGADVSAMWHMLDAAHAELALMPPRRFPTEQYKNLLHSCHISVGLCYTLLNAMQCGDITLEVAHRHVGTLSEAGVRLTAAFTALGSLIRPPKQKQRHFARLRMLARRRAAAKAAGGEDEAEPLPASNATAAAAGAALPGSTLARPPSRTRDVEGAAEAHVCADRAADVDDPFAELDGSGDDEPLPVVALSESQIMSAQQMARHLSRQLQRHPSADSDADRHAADGGLTRPDPPLAKLSPLAEGAGSEGLAGSGSGCGPQPRLSLGPAASAAFGLGASPSAGPEQRRDWALAKLAALVEAVQQLEAAALQERKAQPDAEGLPAFIFIVHALINLTRQAGACLTALDPQRGARLHGYFQAARLQSRMLR